MSLAALSGRVVFYVQKGQRNRGTSFLALWLCQGVVVPGLLHVWHSMDYASYGIEPLGLLEEKWSHKRSKHYLECYSWLFNVAYLEREKSEGVWRYWEAYGGSEIELYLNPHGMDGCVVQSSLPFYYYLYWWVHVICVGLVYSLCTSFLLIQ